MSVAEQKSPGLLAGVQTMLARKGRRAWNIEVVETISLTPRLVRVRFKGADLNELDWRRGQDLVLELPTSSGIARRHYTIRDRDAAARTIDIDFVLHGDSPAGNWARAAKPGDRIDAVGPRGRTVIRTDADWHLFTGDETCIPGIFAMLEGLPAGALAHAFIEVESDADKLVFAPRAGTTIAWVPRNGPPCGADTPLVPAVDAFEFPQGHGHAYTIGETSMVRAVRHRLIARGLGKDQICAEGYWRPGRVGGHDHV